MALPGIAQKRCRLSGRLYMPGEPVPAEVMTRRVAQLGLATFVPEAAVAGLQSGKEATVEAFDPGEHKADEVLSFLDANPDQLERVMEAEAAGQQRKGLTAELERRLEAATAPADPPEQ